MFGDLCTQGARSYPGRPNLACGFDAARAVGVFDREPLAVDVDDHGAELYLDAHILQPGLGLLSQVVAHWRQHRGPRVEQNRPRLCRINMAEFAFQGLGGQLGDLACQLHPGRTRADDGERQQLLAVDRIAGSFRGLERANDAPAHFERVIDGFHAGREFGEMVLPEIGLAGAGRDDEAVVRRPVALAEQLRYHIAPGQVDLHDIAEQYLRVALVAKYPPGGRRDLALGQNAGGDLVEQWLEQVMLGASDHRYVDRRMLERLGRRDPTETRTNHDDAMSPASPVCSAGEPAHAGPPLGISA